MKLKMDIQKTLFCLTGMVILAACSKPPAAQQTGSSSPDSNNQTVAATAIASSPISDTTATGEITVAQANDFSDETVGGMPTSFASAVGNWMIVADGDNQVLGVDGSQWEEGQTSAGVAEQARAIYGERYAEFLDNVQAYAYFPFAVAKIPEDFTQGEISLRFKPIDGRIDQAAGIMFNLKPNGDYLVVRANGLEDNLVLFKYERGQRSSVEWVRNVYTETRQWHDLKVVIDDQQVKGYLDGELHLEHTLNEPVSGKVGVWSKADSVVYFDDFQVTPAPN